MKEKGNLPAKTRPLDSVMAIKSVVAFFATTLQETGVIKCVMYMQDLDCFFFFLFLSSNASKTKVLLDMSFTWMIGSKSRTGKT
jgi:hypothetical protein